MKHNTFPGSPEYWLRYAKSDLELAKLKTPNILFETGFKIYCRVQKMLEN